MSKCGVCGWSFSGWALSKHAETACGEEDIKAEVRPYEPAVNDLVRALEEHLGEDIK
jgi:hypothetical protein